MLLPAASAIGQTEKGTPADTTVTFKVFGACIQCKQRIESAIKGRGVKSGNWDIDTKQLVLTYDPTRTSLDRIRRRILDAGHDLEGEKAKDLLYNELPVCCHYRDMAEMAAPGKSDTASAITDSADSDGSGTIRGIVLKTDEKGLFRPLPGASITWMNMPTGTVTDSAGVFHIRQGAGRLIVSYTGYQADTIAVVDKKELKIILASRNQLQEVKVISRLQSMYISSLNPVRTQVMTDRELFKAACCNLSESFETNPSVDVSYSDAVTGSKQIQLLGLSGNYTQLTVENLPGPRGIATPLGLNSIAGPWVESIQLSKGTGSVANGFESIAGQINVELKKPENSERIYANAYVNDFGKTDLNLNLTQRVGSKWSTGLLLHDDLLLNKHLDENKDGFRDLPTGNQISLVNRWKYDDGKGLLTQFGIKVLNDERTGGQTAFNPSSDKFTQNYYGLGINTTRFEAFGKIGYVFPEARYKSIGLQLDAIDHRQDSYFGLTVYNATQRTLYGNLIYQSIINSTIHKFRTGISFSSDDYDENFKSVIYKRTEVVPGAFFEYTYTPTEKFSLVAGLRVDHHNLYGNFLTPRLNVRYEPVKGTTFRLSAGRGQRTANIFAENMSVFVSGRDVEILGASSGKAYGLNPEVAWNKGISFDQKLRLFQNDALVTLDFFRNDFTDQVVVDLENPRLVKFYNLQGKSWSNSFQAEVNLEPIRKLEVRVAYRYFNVKTTYSGELLSRPLISTNRAFISLDYSVRGWKFDYTVNYNGRKRIPNTAANPPQYQLSAYSPDFILMNAQVSKTVGKEHPMDFYVGAENLGDYFQKNPIVAADQPFGPYFDASMVWGPVTGRMLYAGWRLKIK